VGWIGLWYNSHDQYKERPMRMKPGSRRDGGSYLLGSFRIRVAEIGLEERT
jgi:hypothetical protein